MWGGAGGWGRLKTKTIHYTFHYRGCRVARGEISHFKSLMQSARDAMSFQGERIGNLGAGGLGGSASGHLYSTFALIPLSESGAATFHAQAYIPTQPAQAIQDTWISHAHEDPGRQEGNFPPPRQGAQAGLGKTRFPRVARVSRTVWSASPLTARNHRE